MYIYKESIYVIGLKDKVKYFFPDIIVSLHIFSGNWSLCYMIEFIHKVGLQIQDNLAWKTLLVWKLEK